METVLAILCGCLVAGGIYLLLSQDLVRMLFGLIMLSNAVNLAIFAAGDLTHTQPALIAAGQTVPDGAVANALPQALILTAIVIGFALLVFMFVLFYRSYEVLGTTDTRRLDDEEPAHQAPSERPIPGPEMRP
jgi:multicomponent Na+:H+ antiporter subunit C